MICSSIFYGKNYHKLLGESVFKTKLKLIELKCKIDMFLMTVDIGGTFGFADYESGGRRGLDTDLHFGCIINFLLIHFWIYYHLSILLIDFIISYY